MSGHPKKSKLAFFIFMAVVMVMMSGYFFAKKKSEPEFRTKIERIMFEKKNKSPKYILSLPEKKQNLPSKTKPSFLSEEPVKLETIEDFVKAAPLLAKLKDSSNHYSLNVVANIPDLIE